MTSPLDPASVASYVAQAKARTDDDAFAVIVAPTGLAFGSSTNVREVLARLYKPADPPSARLYSWKIRYRYRGLSAWLVADAAFATQVTGALALLALEQMGLVDLRYPVTTLAPYNPVLGGKPSDPFAPPKMRWIGTGSGGGYWSR